MHSAVAIARRAATMAALEQTAIKNDPTHHSSTQIASPPTIAVAPQATVFQRQSSLSFTSEQDDMVHREDSVGVGASYSHNLSEEGITSDAVDSKEKKRGVFDTRKKKIVMLCVALYWFICCCAFAMIAPFFPGEVSIKLRVKSNRQMMMILFTVQTYMPLHAGSVFIRSRNKRANFKYS